MRNRVFGLAVGVTLAVLVGVGSAAASSPSRVLKFNSVSGQFTAVGFSGNPNVPPPIGTTFVGAITLYNQVAQFGKPAGVRVGSVELKCTEASYLRSICEGVAHVPDGFLTFSGASLNNNGPVSWYAITGGVAAYATARGEIKTTNVGGQNSNKSTAVVTLYQ